MDARRLLLVSLAAALIPGAAFPGGPPAGPPAPAAGLLAAPGFHHLHLRTTDPDAAIGFYRRQFPSTSRATVGGFPALQSGQVHLLFTNVPAAPPAPSQSAYWHFGFHVVDAHRNWLDYRERRVKLLPLHTDDGRQVTFSGEWWPGTLTRAQAARARAAESAAAGGVGWGYIEGPDGVPVEFQGNLPAERVNHVHMFQDDVFCAERWYQTHLLAPLSATARRGTGRPPAAADCRVPLTEPSWLSLEQQGTIRAPAGGVRFGDVDVNWYQRQGGRPPASSRGQAMDHIGVGVADLDAWLDKLSAEGVTILEPPYAFGDTRAFLIEGPSREVIELVGLP